MSEYTTIYLRNKNTPLLDYKEQPSWEEIQNLSEDEIRRLRKEVDEYNRTVVKSFGCELFYLSTTPSRHLSVLPWNPSPRVLTKELLEEVIDFYKEEIEDYKKYIARNKESIAKLEARIAKANVELYDKISEEIDECYDNINSGEEELEHYQYLHSKFDFLKGIFDEESNLEEYELIYTKS